MSEEKLDKLIELNERIVRQNDEIIALLKELNGSEYDVNSPEDIAKRR